MGNSCCGLPDPLASEGSSQYKPSKRKMNYNKPTQFTKGVSIKKNPETGMYEGVPKQWLQNNEIDLNADTSKTVATSHFSDSIRPTPVLPTKILNMVESVPVRQSSYLPSIRSAQGPSSGLSTQPMTYPVKHFGR